jgi:iron complex transport system substrate-binding protein
MVTRQTRLTCAVLFAAALIATKNAPVGIPSFAIGAPASAQAARPAKRIVSLVPALTEILFAIGAGPQIVGVSNFDAFPPAVKALPHVGALLDPDTERILTLRPDLVVTYGSQTDLETRFESAGVKVFSYRHAGIDGVLTTMRRLGEATGHAEDADKAARDLRRRLDAIRDRVRGLPRPRTLLVFERTPMTLRGLYVSGGTGFINDMLEAAGAVNVFADVKRESVQPSQEVLLKRAPDTILEIRASEALGPADILKDHAVWNTLASIPAVRQHRVYFLAGEQLVIPGPRLAAGVEMIARAIHPDVFK